MTTTSTSLTRYGVAPPRQVRDEPGVSVWHGDCRDHMAFMPDGTVDAVIVDPPYEKGIAGKAWDRTGIAFDLTVWAEAHRVAKPGAWLAAFGDSARVHRMTCAIEDAGWEIVKVMPWLHQAGKGQPHLLKPAHEPIVLARKTRGAGMNIDAARIPRAEGDRTSYGRGRDLPETIGMSGVVGKYGKIAAYLPHPDGRHPNDVLLAHAPIVDADGAFIGDACADGCVPGCQVAALDVEGGWPVFRYEKVVRDRRERPHYVDADGVLRTHPTVKPLALMEWLIRLLVAKGGVVLDFFAGSGSTGEAAIRSGWCEAILTENDVNHLPLIDIRIDRARHSVAAAEAAATVALW